MRSRIKTPLTDFRLGYGLAVVIALSFVAMGTAVLFETGREAPASAAGFATELFSIFTTVIGNWSYPFIAATGIAVMWSTQVALMDALPRVTDRLASILQGRPSTAPDRYMLFSLIQVAGVAFMLLFMMRSFASFIAFATSAGFIAAPAIAYYNYKAVTADEVSKEYRPSTRLTLWNWVSVFALGAFAVAFVWTQVVWR